MRALCAPWSSTATPKPPVNTPLIHSRPVCKADTRPAAAPREQTASPVRLQGCKQARLQPNPPPAAASPVLTLSRSRSSYMRLMPTTPVPPLLPPPDAGGSRCGSPRLPFLPSALSSPHTRSHLEQITDQVDADYSGAAAHTTQVVALDVGTHVEPGET